MSHQLFVYGSLRSDYGHAAHSYMDNNFRLLGPARVKGELYDMGEYPAAVPTKKDSYIIGELYALKEAKAFDIAIAPLDEYEGLNPAADEIALYRRELTTVYTNNQSNTTAWIYWYNNNVTGKPLIASGDVLQYIQQNK